MEAIMKHYLKLFSFMIIFLTTISIELSAQEIFNFKSIIFSEDASTLFAWVQNIDTITGLVEINGYDDSELTFSFEWDWGDGVVETGLFPKSHQYTDLSRNYILKVTVFYNDESTDSTEIRIVFSSIEDIIKVELPEIIKVIIPDSNITLGTHHYTPPSDLSYFNIAFFDFYPRDIVEYILSIAAAKQMEFVNNNVYLYSDKFQQYVLRDEDMGGMYSLWFTNPVSFAAGNYAFGEELQWSSFFHEMGHNFTLNSPAEFYFGGKIDGNANAIFSESMAQIFQHATAYELINRASDYNLTDEISFDIKQSANSSMSFLKSRYDEYLLRKRFASWNNPLTEEDETLNTFMTIGFVFCEQAELEEEGYALPLKRMMSFLQKFNSEWRFKYSQHQNTAEADSFRATMMVAALSEAFNKDLREKFRDLNFPISDTDFVYLDPNIDPEDIDTIDDGIEPQKYKSFILYLNSPNPFNSTTIISYELKFKTDVTLTIFDGMGREIKTLVDKRQSAGNYCVQFSASGLPRGTYICKLKAGPYVQSQKMLLLY